MMDITPTLLDLVGLDVPADMDGMSLLPLMHGEPGPPNRLIVSEMAGETNPDGLTYWIAPRAPIYSVKQNGWKLIHTQQLPAGDALYLLNESSVYEQEDLALREPEKAGELFAKLQAALGVPDRFLFLPTVQGE